MLEQMKHVSVYHCIEGYIRIHIYLQACSIVIKRFICRSFSFIHTAPAVVVNLQVIYPAVIWQIPETPNGNIDNYILIFTSDIPGQSPVRVETGTTHYVIKEDTLPSNWGNFTVQVSKTL